MAKLLVCALCLASIWTGAAAQEKQGTPPPTSISPEIGQISNILKSNFEIYHLAPIVIPQGERVGDIIDLKSATLLARAADCFPGLKPSRDVSLLPQITLESERELAAALGAGTIAEAGADGELRTGRTFKLDFDDVHFERVSQYQLRNSLKKNVQECDLVRPFLDASYSRVVSSHRKKARRVEAIVVENSGQTVVAGKPPPLLVGTLFYARRVIHVATTDKVTASAKVTFAEQLMKNLGLGSTFKASLGGGDLSNTTVDIVGTNAVPVALHRPLSLQQPNNSQTVAQNITLLA